MHFGWAWNKNHLLVKTYRKRRESKKKKEKCFVTVDGKAHLVAVARAIHWYKDCMINCLLQCNFNIRLWFRWKFEIDEVLMMMTMHPIYASKWQKSQWINAGTDVKHRRATKSKKFKCTQRVLGAWESTTILLKQKKTRKTVNWIKN